MIKRLIAWLFGRKKHKCAVYDPIKIVKPIRKNKGKRK